jgi:cathepsin L
MARLAIIVAVALFVAVAFATTEDEYRTEFSKFVSTYKKTYRPAEMRARFAIFKNNYDFINSYNAKKNGVTLAVNAFADLTNQEFTAMYTGYNTTAVVQRKKAIVQTSEVIAPAATCPKGTIAPNSSCDWRAANIVTPIKNQGQCGSCWAFSTTGSTEGAHAQKTGKLVSLSEQNLVDCSQSEGNEGCNGGLMDYAFEYIIKNKGIDTEASYPYKAQDEHCKFTAANVGATLTSYKDIPSKNEAALTTAITTVGPISVAIDASHNSFQFYSKGVYYEAACSSTELDHGVLAVGIGQTNNAEYYIVKNSWGTSWGDSGYILMSRDRKNNCGIATAASYPIA